MKVTEIVETMEKSLEDIHNAIDGLNYSNAFTVLSASLFTFLEHVHEQFIKMHTSAEKSMGIPVMDPFVMILEDTIEEFKKKHNLT